MFEKAKKNGETVVVTAWNEVLRNMQKAKSVCLIKHKRNFKDVFVFILQPSKMKDVAKYLKIGT